MDIINILIIASAVILILLLWLVVGFRHLKHLKLAVKDQWEFVDEDLRKRQSLVPNLIETVRIYDQTREELIEKVITMRYKAAKEYNPGARKIEYEHDLSMAINELIGLGSNSGGSADVADLGSDTNFLELKKEIDDLEKNIEDRTNKYNAMVRYYNTHRRILFLQPLAGLFRFGVEDIFEMER